MRIEFHDKKTKKIIRGMDCDLFVSELGEVWADNGEYSEGSSQVIRLDNFLEKRPDIGWRVIEQEAE